ncbi:hypothetical protein [Shouchella shacheensis]|uniref:hypothetical protein n=1 Tax=Shouchella shacheensis TaxID=1649580 RepID=UPI00073FED6A|nr:hypothetical protein [Shouchella shacheensis]
MKKGGTIALGCLISFGLVACTTEKETGTSSNEEALETEVIDVDTDVESKDEPAVENEIADAEEEGIEHHEELPYEWSGSYSFEQGIYSLVFNQNEFGDESMRIAFILENQNIMDLEHHAAHLIDSSAEEVKENNEFQANHEFVYNLSLNEDITQFTFTIKEAGDYAIFTEHHPEEFEMTISDEVGEEISPQNPTVYEEHGHSH